MGEFHDGATYLSPDPSAPFRRLTRQLVTRFPEYPPFGGAYGEVVPHISVPVPPDETPESVRAELEERLPITAHAREAQLVWFAAGDHAACSRGSRSRPRPPDARHPGQRTPRTLRTSTEPSRHTAQATT